MFQDPLELIEILPRLLHRDRAPAVGAGHELLQEVILPERRVAVARHAAHGGSADFRHAYIDPALLTVAAHRLLFADAHFSNRRP